MYESMNKCVGLGWRRLAVLVAGASLHTSPSPAAEGMKDCDVCPEMVTIRAGSFVMGSPAGESGHPDEKPQHQVTIAYPFAVSKYEITFDQWDACAADGRCPRPPDDDLGRGRRPVINVDWSEANAYAAWLSERSGQRYRLLTEAEWEYAARGSTTTPWYWGEADRSAGSKHACEFANTHDETGKEAHPMYVWSNHQCADGYAEAAPVRSFRPNRYGLHDMLGNVREWVADCHRGDYARTPTDGSAAQASPCELRIVRGGAWIDGASTVRAAYRHTLAATHKNHQVGVRVAREIGR